MMVLLFLNTFNVQEAIPIPLIIAGVTILLSLFFSSIWKGTNKKELGLAVLGENQSGKTLWYDFLCNTHNSVVFIQWREKLMLLILNMMMGGRYI